VSDKFIRFKKDQQSQPQYGILKDNKIGIIKQPPWIEKAEVVETIEHDEDLQLLAPVEPSKVICIGLNYHAHVKASYSADEAPENPLLFMKPPSSIIGQDDLIVLPAVSERIDYEAELGVVISKTAREVDENNADDYILGLTCVNDVTARDLQKKDGQWTRAKGFDTFCPVGPWIITGVDYKNIQVEGILNDKVMQSGSTAQMIFDIPFLISYVSSIMTLNPGDLISTGTPAGISPMKAGDKIEVKVENVGTLTNFVA
jgi:2-keto-4-pentenoate hydratase/2-oxohepta-3-ene-1,7-dioic acid hydratase in catechol pathway